MDRNMNSVGSWQMSGIRLSDVPLILSSCNLYLSPLSRTRSQCTRIQAYSGSGLSLSEQTVSPSKLEPPVRRHTSEFQLIKTNSRRPCLGHHNTFVMARVLRSLPSCHSCACQSAEGALRVPLDKEDKLVCARIKRRIRPFLAQNTRVSHYIVL